MKFSIYFEGDAYSTAKKIMGRQSAGKAFLKGVAKFNPSGVVSAVGSHQASAKLLLQQLQDDGFKGKLSWSNLPLQGELVNIGTLYYPAPPAKELAASRNLFNPAAYSLMGVTHTLSSAGAMDQVANLVLPPFQPWDALICTSNAAKSFVSSLQTEMRTYWHETTGATRFTDVQLPVIPLGIDAPAFNRGEGANAQAREELAIVEAEVVFLFAGRLSFHAKANPAPVYQALEKIARDKKIVCIEAGIFPNEAIKQGFLSAQKALAPSVRFIWVDGQDESRYRLAWQASDVFVSLSDNIQETFGLTPVEAMAAGLPVVVSDWNGYKDTVRDGVDGYRIPTILPSAGAGAELALRHALDLDTYDFYIGRTSLATVVDPQALAQALNRLATDADLRRSMGQAGQARAVAEFDWPVILEQYSRLAMQLEEIRSHGRLTPAQPWPQRSDPFHRFAHFSTHTLTAQSHVQAKPDSKARLQTLMSLSMANYAFDARLLPRETLVAMLEVLQSGNASTVGDVLVKTGVNKGLGTRALMWLWKFDLIHVRVLA